MSRLTHICRYLLSGSWFYLVCLYVLKALLANVFSLCCWYFYYIVLGVSSRPFHLCSFSMIISHKYFGVCLLSDFNTSMSILKSSLCCIGNQCSTLRYCVVLFLYLLFKVIIASMFCICCIALIDFFAGLQVWNCSSLDEIELMIWLMCGMCYCQCISWCFWSVLNLQWLVCICWWCEL